jgi:hypothetical protein
MATILKSVRVRGDIKPKEEGGLDGRLEIQLDGKERVAVVYRIDGTINNYTFAPAFFPKKQHGDKTDDEIIKLYLNHYPKWSIIQDPFDPNVIPPDNNFKPENNNTSTGIKYTADTTLSLESSWVTRDDHKPNIDSGKYVVKSYTFILKNPKNDDEKKVKAIIWVADLDASEMVKTTSDNIRGVYTGTFIINTSPEKTAPYPTSGNYQGWYKIINTPSINPKDGKTTNKSGAEEEKNSLYTLLAAKNDDKSFKGTLNNINDYIDYIIPFIKFNYKNNIYNLTFSSTADFPKFELPENSVEFIQSSQASQEEVKPDPVTESTTAPTETIKPLYSPDKIFTFNVEKSGIVINPEIGTFSIVDMTPEFQFSNAIDEIPLDAEYTEDLFIGPSELPIELEVLREQETSKELDKNLSDSDKIGSDVATQGGSIKLGDDADFWSLVAICSLEDGDDQARADIAQSIYNRVGSKIYSSSIKKVVTAKWQYEPAFQKGAGDGTVAQEWKNINSKETAIKALIYTKGWSRDTAAAALKKCFEAIKNPSYQKEANKFIGGRTDFLSENQGLPEAKNKKDPSKKAIMRNSGRPNNVFAWNYNYKKNNAYDPPSPDWFNKYANNF